MTNDPGSRLDFGTFIAYLMPGYILAFLLFCLGDITTVLISGRSLIFGASTWGLVEITLATIISVPISYFLGLVLDAVAHPLTLQSELRAKEDAYKDAIEQFRELLNVQLKGILQGKEIEPFLSTLSTSSSDLATRDFFIDMMFYRLASSEVWARQSWHWSFYEMLRQLGLLFVPATAIISFYIVLLIEVSTSLRFNLIVTLMIPIGLAGLLTFFGWISPARRFLQEERDLSCRIYYRHRAWVVFAYLIDIGLLTNSQEHARENAPKGPVGAMDFIRTWYHGADTTSKNH